MSAQQNSSDSEHVKVFVSDEHGPEEFVGFFEDDGETGYLYVSDRKRGEIVKHLQIYNNSQALCVDAKDVHVVWSGDGSKCGVLIWGAMRGIIDLVKRKEGRVLVESRDTPPIKDKEWLKGFV